VYLTFADLKLSSVADSAWIAKIAGIAKIGNFEMAAGATASE
jgi:hypothetical protein